MRIVKTTIDLGLPRKAHTVVLPKCDLCMLIYVLNLGIETTKDTAMAEYIIDAIEKVNSMLKDY